MNGLPVSNAAREVIGAGGYLSPEWHTARRSTVSASEIPAVLGLSPWTSAFDLWWAKRLGDEPPDSPAKRRGRRLESMVLEDFAEAHPELSLSSAGLCVSEARPWQACTPDALAYEHNDRPDWEQAMDGAEPVAVVEAKTAGSSEGWGQRGTDDVPAHYRAQVLWQMDVLGVPVAYLAVWVGFDYREYEVPYDADDAAFMRNAAREFLDSLAGEHPPPIDAHQATGRRLKKLHPSVIDDEVEVTGEWVEAYRAAKGARDVAQKAMDLAEHHLRNEMGDYRVATVGGVKVATRSVSDVPERTQTVKAHTRNTIRFTKGTA